MIYFAQEAGADGAVKIGYVHNPMRLETRVKSLQTGNYRPLTVVAELVHGAYETEKKLHRHFAEARLRGEWFAPTRELNALIDWIQLNEAARWPEIQAALRSQPRPPRKERIHERIQHEAAAGALQITHANGRRITRDHVCPVCTEPLYAGQEGVDVGALELAHPGCAQEKFARSKAVKECPLCDYDIMVSEPVRKPQKMGWAHSSCALKSGLTLDK
jgi:hypothetical protein